MSRVQRGVPCENYRTLSIAAINFKLVRFRQILVKRIRRDNDAMNGSHYITLQPMNFTACRKTVQSGAACLMMLVPILMAVLKMLLLSPASTTKPVKFGTMKLSFTPGSALVINEGESQIFR